MSEIFGFLALCFRITHLVTLNVLLRVQEPFLGPDHFLLGEQELHPVAFERIF